jgi:hypothetical protein
MAHIKRVLLNIQKKKSKLFLVCKPLGAGLDSQVIDQKHVTAVPQSTGQLSHLL